MAFDYSEILDSIMRKTNTQNNTTSSYPLAAKTVDVNSALNWYFILANSSDGNWRPADDTNQVDYPIIYGDVVSGQQDYSFTEDFQGNQILDVYKVRILNPDGINWTTLRQINQDEITDDQLSTVNGSTPEEYYLTANGIFLVQKPNYDMTDGLEIWVNRTPTYFTVSDTTKKPGIPWVHIDYLSLRPSYFYCLAKGLPQAPAYKIALYGEDGKSGMEGAIKKYWKNRNKDFTQTITPETISSI
jgi:hypothetical protein